ncbi:hypothetical protein ACMT1E_13440 [Sphingomonas flavalba]|uniref:hypothetical protein n=1 Tax=Sphingomonas flavalba TaxID=2559804 RepID=UPI0039DFC535
MKPPVPADRTPTLIVGAAALAALAVPLWLLRVGGAPPPTAPLPRPATMQVADAVPLDRLAARHPFGNTRPPAVETDTAQTDDGPDLAGIVGRFPRAGRAMVRIGGGRTRTLKVGDRVDGWRLIALTSSRATFRRGDRRVVRRVE